MDRTLKYYLLIIFAGSLLLLNCNQGNSKPLYKDPNQPVEIRVQDLLSRMTLEEKIAQMSEVGCDNMIQDNLVKSALISEKVLQNGVGAIHGFTLSSMEYAKISNRIQQELLNNSRLGIPALFIGEGLHGVVQDGATIFPQAIGMASTWNPDLINKVSTAIHNEARAVGMNQVLSPVLDVAREQRWGRVEETYGEDPYLIGQMAHAFITGLQQGNNDRKTIAATPKHFIAYSEPRGGLNLASSPGGWYNLYNIHFPPFKKVVRDADVLSLMNSYNSYDGYPVSSNHKILTEILRKRWGFDGYIYSDWGSIHMIHSFHKTAKSTAEAGKFAVEAGIDLEAPGPACYQHLDSLVRNNIVDKQVIDTAAARVLRTKFKIGLFEDPFVDIDEVEKRINTKEHIKLSKKVADESLVLLKNDDNILPISGNINSIAVIGPNADQVQFGDYTWSRNNQDGITVLEGIQQVAETNTKINYAKGCDLTSLDKSGFPKAIQAARTSAVAIVCIGTASASLARDYSKATSGEGFDLADTSPTGVQLELVKQIHKTGTPTIVVLIQGKPFSISWMKANIPGIIEAWYPGEQGGLSIAEAIFGKSNPSGRLPISFPKSVGHLPCFYNYLPTDKGYYRSPGEYGDPGRDYVFSSPESLWPFGFGLSYSEFEYQNVEFSDSSLQKGEKLTVSVTIKNTGEITGKETVQLYIRDIYSSVLRPVKELKAFKKVEIEPGETETINLTVNTRDMGYYNNKGEYLLEPGTFTVMIGENSRDIMFKSKITYNPDK